MKMTLGMEVGLGPDHIVLDEDPAPLPKRGHNPLFWPISIVAKRLDASRCHLVWRYRPRPRPHCAILGPSYPKKGHSLPNFRPMSIVSKRLSDQDVIWYGGRPRPRRRCVIRGPSSPSPAKGAQQPPSFRPIFIVATIAHLSYC